MVGTLWVALADYYIRQGNFDKVLVPGYEGISDGVRGGISAGVRK